MGYLLNKTGNMLTNIYLNYFTFLCLSFNRSQLAVATEKEFDAQIFMEISFLEKTPGGNFSHRVICDNGKRK